MAPTNKSRARTLTLSKPTLGDEPVDTDIARPVLSGIVGIGASAGGVEALSRFFGAMSADSACAFVIVLHLDPTRESQMARVLSSHTKMPVLQVEDKMRIEPNHIYVIAPDYHLEISGGALHLLKPLELRGHRKPVDVFFRSLARDQGDRSIAIVLSGTGTNGTDGLKDVRAAGGVIFAQAPDTAKFDGMPSSAIAADLVDYILAPEKMPETLLTFLGHRSLALPSESLAAPDAQTGYCEVLEILRTRGAHDFRSYKLSTLSRRIQRRLSLKDIETLDEYAGVLRNDSGETAALIKDLMINVTSFFRDPEAWQTLQEKVIEPMIANRENQSSIRVWTPGCSTGEEAYSIAMLVTEQAEAAGKQFNLKVFATDAQEGNLQKARAGIYPEAALSGFLPERLKRFFDKVDGSYQVRKDLRDMVVFAPHNLLRDPPFSRLDLISCRNLLIYLEADAQKKIIALAHFALSNDGHLFLGNAETIGRHEDLFETISKKWRIYRKIGPTRHNLLDFPLSPGISKSRPINEPSTFLESNASVAEVARRALLERYAPASVLIDWNSRVLYFHGPTGDYLEQPTGEPTKDLIAMARHGLSAKLRDAVHEAMDGSKHVTASAHVRYEGVSHPVTIIVTRLPVATGDGDRMLVSFEQTPAAPMLSDVNRQNLRQNANDDHNLQEELATVRVRLQNTIEHLETTNEELKASNEEATSMNEELQSTNEELETSKEELQSFNEELNTINSQLQHKIVELENATNDLNNLLTGSEVATLFLDNKFCIKWFSPTTRELFDLVSSDIGRPVSHFARKFADEKLLPDAKVVLNKLSIIEAEVSADSGRWYLRRMLPYRTRDNHIAGVVVTFNDITDRKRATDAADDARVYSEAIVDTIRQPLLVLTSDLRVRSANRAFYNQFRVRQQDTEGQLFYSLGNGQWGIPRLQALLKEVLSKNQFVEDFEVEHVFSGIGRRSMLLNARKLVREDRDEELIVLAIEDVSERKESENTARQGARFLKDLIDALPGAVYTTDANGLITSYNPAAVKLWGREPQLGVDRWHGALRMYRADGASLLRGDCPMAIAVKEDRQIMGAEALVERDDGTRIAFLAYPTPLHDASGTVIGAVNMLMDITERQRAEEHRITLVDELNHRVKNTLAVIQFIASQTFGHAGASTLEEAREAFESRLINLAKAHDVLTRENWISASLIKIVADTINPYSGGGSRFSTDGPDISLVPSAALAIAMALHELATNATKYGALSCHEGCVDITWRIDGDGDDRRLKLSWTESGGPIVIEPTRKGFGSRLIERALAAELDGTVRLAYEPTGVVCMIEAPLLKIQSSQKGFAN